MRVGPTRTIALLAVMASFLASASVAFAWNETGMIPKGGSNGYGDCGYCHTPGWTNTGYGPHRGYSNGTRVCEHCHTLHDSGSATQLLIGATIQATCQTCHDGSGGRGVYGAIAARGLAVGAQHRTETTAVVPGGDASTGGSAAMMFAGTNGTLTCSDCHTPHGQNAVTPFLGERMRIYMGGYPSYVSNRLLKQRPASVATAVAEYGSDWCMACHQGRASGVAGGAMNHPVESTLTTASPYNYRQLGIITGSGAVATTATAVGFAGNNYGYSYNTGYLMPYPRVGTQAGHLPICQQCHEDTRFVGTLTDDGTQAIPSRTTILAGDGWQSVENPRFQNFPHETQGYRMLVEATTTAFMDDLCLNCHPTPALP